MDALTEDEVHAAALSDPDAQPLTAERLATMRRVVNVKKLRERLGLTQQTFAETYGIPVGTLRDWEQRRKHPDAPATGHRRLRGGGHRRDQGGVEGCGLRAAEGDPHAHSVHHSGPGSRCETA